MNWREWFIDLIVVFAVALAAGIGVTLVWNLIGHHEATVEWKTAFTLAIVLGIVLSLSKARSAKSGKP
jgi:high-affinity Fe2+/Pb2+ permease